MKIVFLNTWDGKLGKEIGHFITSHFQDTEIFCLQEVYKKMKMLCKGFFQEYKVVSDYKHINDNESYFQNTYVRRGLNIISKKTLLKDTQGTGLAVYTQIQSDNKTLHVCNVHGVSQPGDKTDNNYRLQQSLEIIEFFKGIDGLKIIGGDFNLEFDTQSVKMFEESGYKNLIKDFNIPTTRNRLTWEKYLEEGKQYFADYVFVSPDVPIKEFSVPNIEISDHLPMILDIEL